MSDGIQYVAGWPAAASVAALAAALSLAAGALYWRGRALRDEPALPATYRTAAKPGSDRASQLRGLAALLAFLCALTLLLYAGLFVELVEWLLGAGEPPKMVGSLFFWVALVDLTCTGAALFTGLRRSRSALPEEGA